MSSELEAYLRKLEADGYDVDRRTSLFLWVAFKPDVGPYGRWLLGIDPARIAESQLFYSRPRNLFENFYALKPMTDCDVESLRRIMQWAGVRN